MKLETTTLALALAVSALALSGCWTNRADLDPAPQAMLAGDDLATASADGVTLLVHPDAWDGDDEVLDQVTPLWLGLRNDSARPIAVRYAGVRLVGHERIHAALPPIVADEDTIRLLGEGYENGDPMLAEALIDGRPFAARERFLVDPHMAPLWRELPTLVMPPADLHEDPDESYANASTFEGNENDPDVDYYESVFDPGYWSRHERWAADTRPIHPLVVAALPEGVLLPGGQVEGLVYFERVPDDLDSLLGSEPEPHLELVYDLVDARTDERFGRLRIPFIID